jgi:hypothetical protein
MPLFLLLLLLLLNTPLHAQPFPSLLAGKRSAEEIEGWLADPHPPMPNLDLSRQEINDIMAYLQSLTGQ